MSDQINRQLFQFIEKSPCSYHAVEQIKRELTENGFTELREQEAWKIEKGGKYFTSRNGSSLAAFCIPEKKLKGFHITASHTDSPAFKIKENMELQAEKHYTKLNTENMGECSWTPGLTVRSLWQEKLLWETGKNLRKS